VTAGVATPKVEVESGIGVVGGGGVGTGMGVGVSAGVGCWIFDKSAGEKVDKDDSPLAIVLSWLFVGGVCVGIGGAADIGALEGPDQLKPLLVAPLLGAVDSLVGILPEGVDSGLSAAAGGAGGCVLNPDKSSPDPAGGVWGRALVVKGEAPKFPSVDKLGAEGFPERSDVGEALGSRVDELGSGFPPGKEGDPFKGGLGAWGLDERSEFKSDELFWLFWSFIWASF
jgi:hypothetical protein